MFFPVSEGPQRKWPSHLSGDPHINSLFIGFSYFPASPPLSLKDTSWDRLPNELTYTQILSSGPVFGGIQTKADPS